MPMWSLQNELKYFQTVLNNFLSVDDLFYNINKVRCAYVPKKSSAEGVVLNARNTSIGDFTEQWCEQLFNIVLKDTGYKAISKVECKELGLISSSRADLAICKKEGKLQKSEDIVAIFEVKMSIMHNWKYENDGKISEIGDYTTHKGQPSLTRSDSMLKAIGKMINIRVSCKDANRIPLIILGNSPISDNYLSKVDHLYHAGVVQGVWSLYPNPTEKEYNKQSPDLGFQTMQDIADLTKNCLNILNSDLYYFSSMKSKKLIGEYIRISSQETNDVKRAEKFLSLIEA